MDKSRRKEFIHNQKQNKKYSQWDELKTLGETSWDDLTDEQIRRLDDLTRPEGAEPFSFNESNEESSNQAGESSHINLDYNEVDMFDLSKDNQFSVKDDGSKVFFGEDARQKNRETKVARTIDTWKKDLESRNKPSSSNAEVRDKDQYASDDVVTMDVANEPKMSQAEFYEAIRKKVSELSEDHKTDYDIMSSIIDTQRKAELDQKNADKDAAKGDNIDKFKTDKEKNKKKGNSIINLLKKNFKWMAGLAIFASLAGIVGAQNQNSSKQAGTNEGDRISQETDSSTKTSEEAYDEIVSGKGIGAFEQGGQDKDKNGETGAESLTNNGRYDKQNDTYWSQMNLKRNGEDIGNISTFDNKSPEQIMEMHRNGSLEDNLSYQSQFMFMDSLAEKYFGISTSEAQDLYSRAQNGDQEAFKKINEGFKKMVSEVDRFEWAGNVPSNFSSFFGDMNENGHITMSMAHNLNYDDKMLNMVFKDGENISLDGTCTQIVIKGVVVELPELKKFTSPEKVVVIPEGDTPEDPNNGTPKGPEGDTPEDPNSGTPKGPEGDTPEDPTTVREKNFRLQDRGTYNGVTVRIEGHVTSAVTDTEVANSVDPDAQSGDNVREVVAEGASTETNAGLNNTAQFDGDTDTEAAKLQRAQNQEEHLKQELNNAEAKEQAEVKTVFVEGVGELNTDEIAEVQSSTTQGNQ